MLYSPLNRNCVDNKNIPEKNMMDYHVEINNTFCDEKLDYHIHDEKFHVEDIDYDDENNMVEFNLFKNEEEENLDIFNNVKLDLRFNNENNNNNVLKNITNELELEKFSINKLSEDQIKLNNVIMGLKIDDTDFFGDIKEDENENIGILEEDIGYYEEKPFNLETEERLLNVVNKVNFSIGDIFVEKPKRFKNKQNINTYSKQNYLINKLRHQLPLKEYLILTKYCNLSSYKVLKVTDYIETYSYIMNKYIKTKNDQYNECLYTLIYYYYCNCYIISYF